MNVRKRNFPFLIAVVALSLAACNASVQPDIAQTSTARGVGRPASSNPIKHVVIVVQENRSFNNLFYGFPGATTARYGFDTKGNKIDLQPIPLETTWDLGHSATAFFLACNGAGSIPGTNCKMNGFDQEWVGCGQGSAQRCPNSNPPYSYVPHNETKPYFDMGEQYVVADQMYASNFDESSFIAHQYLIAAQAKDAVNFPFGAWGCLGGSGDVVDKIGPNRQVPDGDEEPCFRDVTLGEEADKAGVSWAYYTIETRDEGDLWNAYQANKYVYYGSDWSNDVISPQTTFFSDLSSGNLRQITWITPTCANSDHAGCNSNTGPSWVTSIVNAVGESKYWKSTAIFILWDDPGGWFDPKPPPYVDNDGFGMRIPMIVVSPYAKKKYVSHVQYEHGSILRFVEDTFGLPRMAASDTRATSPAEDCFSFSKEPRKFKKISAPYGRWYFLHQPLDLRPPDTN